MPTDAEIAQAREVYRALWAAGRAGLDRDALAHKLGLEDRAMRDAVALCARLAANPTTPGATPEVVGFDPAIERYVIAACPEQADRILAYQFSYIRSGLERLQAMAVARRARWGDPPKQERAVQEALFGAEQLKNTWRFQ